MDRSAGAGADAGGLADAVGGQETVEIPFGRHRPVQLQRFGRVALGQLQAARAPVAPAVALRQFAVEAVGELVGFFPAFQAQQQAHAPFGERCIAQLRIVVGHQAQGAAIEAFRQA